MAKFLTFITGIETLTGVGNAGDGDCIFHFYCSGYGVPGDSGADIELPLLECSGDMVFLPHAEITFPIFEIISENSFTGDVVLPLIECDGTLDLPNHGNAPFPLLECLGVGRSGNDGNCNFYLLLVDGEGNANREYELCD